MYCGKCGSKNPDEANFCKDCGAGIKANITSETLEKKPVIKSKETIRSIPKIIDIKNNKIAPQNDNSKLISDISDEKIIKVQKIIRDAANSSIAMSIIGLVFSIIVNIEKLTTMELIFLTIIISPFLLPFYYYGNKLKKAGTDNLNLAFKVSKGMLIYSVIFVVINASMGAVGFLWLIVVYYFYKSYREIKILLENPNIQL